MVFTLVVGFWLQSGVSSPPDRPLPPPPPAVDPCGSEASKIIERERRTQSAAQRPDAAGPGAADFVRLRTLDVVGRTCAGGAK